jgi:transposase
MHSDRQCTSASTNVSAWAGCDVSKATFDAAVIHPVRADVPARIDEIAVREFQRTRQGVRAFLAWVDERVADPTARCRVVMEATGKYSMELAAWMIDERPGLSPAIVNPETAHRFAQSLALRNRTDRSAARALARYGAERRPVAYEAPSPELARLRDIVRHRQAVIAMRVAEGNRAKESYESPTVRAMLKRHVRQLVRDEKRLEEHIRQALSLTPQLRHDAALLQTVYGVGLITAASVLSELGDLRRFKKARQLTAFAGVSPRQERSGTSVRKRTRMSKKGSARVRQVLYMAAMTVIGGDNDLADDYRRLVAAGKAKMAALGVVMRKLLVVMRAVLISGEPFDRHYHRAVHNCR